MRVPRVVLNFLRRRYLCQISVVPGTELLATPDALYHYGPDEVIGPGMRWRKARSEGEHPKNPFLFRWFIDGRKHRLYNRYLHCFVRDDEDRALHDHPWFNLSILLSGSYIEHTVDAGGVHRRTIYRAGDIKFRSPWSAHRVELLKAYDSEQPGTSLKPIPAWSLFLTGPVMRKRWGFHCPETGWRSSHDFHINGGCD